LKYVLGGGISGLLWAYYHPEYVVLTDRVGRAVAGTDAMIWLNDTESTRRWLRDMIGPSAPMIIREQPIGYLSSQVGRVSGILRHDYVSDLMADEILLKKMVPWGMVFEASRLRIGLSVRTPSRKFTKNSGSIRYLAHSVSELGARLVESMSDRIKIARVSSISSDRLQVSGGESLEYDHVVSTIPAPVFCRLWSGDWPGGMPELHYLPVTFAITEKTPFWWDDRFAMIYVGDPSYPSVRVAVVGGPVERECVHEITGMVSEDFLRQELGAQETFVNPFGRIYQDIDLCSPSSKVRFLGRTAEWRYDGLIDKVLDQVLDAG